MITGVAHTAVCVPDVEAAVAWYRDVLGLAVLSPPYLMEGDAIAADMGELIPEPRLKGAIVGLPGDGDRVLELLEYPGTLGGRRDAGLTDHGLTHVALLCDDVEAARRDLEGKGLVQKTHTDRPYFAQWG